MVAMACPEAGTPANQLYHNKFLTAAGKWQTDNDYKATCKKDKVEILEYCKKVKIFLLNFWMFWMFYFSSYELKRKEPFSYTEWIGI